MSKRIWASSYKSLWLSVDSRYFLFLTNHRPPFGCPVQSALSCQLSVYFLISTVFYFDHLIWFDIVIALEVVLHTFLCKPKYCSTNSKRKKIWKKLYYANILFTLNKDFVNEFSTSSNYWFTETNYYCALFCFSSIPPVVFPHAPPSYTPPPMSLTKSFIVCDHTGITLAPITRDANLKNNLKKIWP